MQTSSVAQHAFSKDLRRDADQNIANCKQRRNCGKTLQAYANSIHYADIRSQVRIIRTAKALGIGTISIYTSADAASLHVSHADEALLLAGDDSRAYTDGEQIIRIAKDKHVDAIIPGYGFLSENAGFAREVEAAGIIWCGPSPVAIEQFGVKHIARALAQKAGVSTVPGTVGLVEGEDEAVAESEKLGYPVMLKATGGGGGMGLVTCETPDAVRKGFASVRSRGEQLFQNPGVFIERYYPASHHIEVQVFGNGLGQAIHLGERECSIQRRHQKVVEECPSPFIERHPELKLREKLGQAAIALAETVKYGSAGTVEFLVDDNTGDYFFLEMNTRLQVEHGITELCYGVDLVEMMLQQADAQLAGRGGISQSELVHIQSRSQAHDGHAIEVRVYAENPVRDFAPSPGLLQKVQWHQMDGVRIDTFAFTGSTISPYYDPMIAKVMFHSNTRESALQGLVHVLERSSICGPPNNLDYLLTILNDERFRIGSTLTSFLKDMPYAPSAINVISGGAYTLIEDLPGRPTVGMGICHSGAMDPVAISLANMLVGNEDGKEALEITLSGPELHFLGDAVVALTGANTPSHLDGQEFPMWTRVHIKAGQKLKIGKATGTGCRSYLAVHGGFPSIANYFGSKSTSPVVAIGGIQGRALASGDLLNIVSSFPQDLDNSISIPERLRPGYSHEWEIASMDGPHDTEYFTANDIDMIYGTDWTVSHNASRSAIRLNGPQPDWARKDGVEGGAHPSNVVEYGYPLYGLNWTGDNPAMIMPDGPNFGGFVCSNTVASADYWKVGQMRAGDTMRYKRVTLAEAIELRKRIAVFIESVRRALQQGTWPDIIPLEMTVSASTTTERSVIYDRPAQGHIPRLRIRQGGDQHLIVCYSSDTDHFDINNRVRVTALEKAMKEGTPIWLKKGLYTTVGCCNTLTLYYDSTKVERAQLVSYLLDLDSSFGDLSASRVPCRRISLPLSFSSKDQDQANERYAETQRPYAPYLPSNFDFVARNNAFSTEQLKQCFLQGDFLTVFVGFYCGLPDAIPIDPRNRFFAPKCNPSRVFTPEGTVGLGGGAIAIYPVDSPGGYQMCGRTLPCWDCYGWREGFGPDQPWLFQDFDLIRFYEVSEEELAEELSKFRAGRYNGSNEDGDQRQRS